MAIPVSKIDRMKKLALLGCFLHCLLLTGFFTFGQELKIGNQVWAENNLNTSVFINGDTIFRATNSQEWITASENGIPAWCYTNNNSFSQQEKLYNLHAIKDERGLAPNGWKIPTAEEYIELINFYGGLEGKITENDRKFYAKKFKKLRRKFKCASNDSLFLSKHDDYFNPENLTFIVPKKSKMILMSQDHLSDKTISEIEKTKKKRVLPFILEENKISLIKVVDFKNTDYASVRHILFQFKEEDSVTLMAKADSVLNVIKQKDNFDEMVEIFSDDPGSVNRGGVYNDFTQGMMVPSFNDFCFNNSKGSIGIITSDFGIHIIEVLDRYSEIRPEIFRVTQHIRPGNAAAIRMKSKKHWNQFPPHGETKDSFLAMPSGYQTTNGHYFGANEQAVFWTSSGWNENEQVFISIVDEFDSVILKSTPHSFGFSVRCIKIIE